MAAIPHAADLRGGGSRASGIIVNDSRIYIVAGLGLLALLFLWLSHRSNRRRRLVEALPTSRVSLRA